MSRRKGLETVIALVIIIASHFILGWITDWGFGVRCLVVAFVGGFILYLLAGVHPSAAPKGSSEDPDSSIPESGVPEPEPPSPAQASAHDEKAAAYTAAVQEPGEAQDAATVEDLVRRMSSVWSQADAQKKIVEMGDRAVIGLMNALSNEDWYVRSFAVKRLGKIGDKRAVRPLIKALQDKDARVGIFAGDALVAIGSPAIEPLRAVLKDPKWGTRLWGLDSSIRHTAQQSLDQIEKKRHLGEHL